MIGSVDKERDAQHLNFHEDEIDALLNGEEEISGIITIESRGEDGYIDDVETDVREIKVETYNNGNEETAYFSDDFRELKLPENPLRTGKKRYDFPNNQNYRTWVRIEGRSTPDWSSDEL